MILHVLDIPMIILLLLQHDYSVGIHFCPPAVNVKFENVQIYDISSALIHDEIMPQSTALVN